MMANLFVSDLITVKPVYKRHLWDYMKVELIDRWSLYAGYGDVMLIKTHVLYLLFTIHVTYYIYIIIHKYFSYTQCDVTTFTRHFAR